MRVLIKIFFIFITFTAYSWAQEMSRYELLDKANELITTDDWEEGLDYYWQALDKGLRPSSQMAQNVYPVGIGFGNYHLDSLYSGPFAHVFTYMEQIHYDEYEEFLAEHARRFPDVEWIQYAYAFRLRLSEQYDLARDYAKKAVQLKPEDYVFQQLYLELLISVGDQTEISKTIDKMLNINVQHSDYRFNYFHGPRLSWLILVAEEMERTEEYFKRVIEKFPLRAAPLVNYAIWLEYKGREKEAEEYYKKSILSGDRINDISSQDIKEYLLKERIIGHQAARRYKKIAETSVGSITNIIKTNKEELLLEALKDEAGFNSIIDILRHLSEEEFDQLYQYFKTIDKGKIKNKKSVYMAFMLHLDMDQNFSKTIEILKDGVAEFPEYDIISSSLIETIAKKERSEGINPSENYKQLYEEHLLRFPADYISGVDDFIFAINPVEERLEEIYLKSIELHPDNPYNYSRMALHLKFNDGEAEEVLKYYDLYVAKALDWIDRQEDKCKGYYNLANFFDDIELPSNSALVYERLYQLDCGQDKIYKGAEIVNLLKMGALDKAVEESLYLLEHYKHYFYEPVISEKSEALEKVATYFVKSPDIDGGVVLLEKLVDTYPDVGFFSYLYGGYLLKNGEYNKADRYILKSIQLSPNINQKLKDHSNDNLSDLEKRFLAIKYAL